MSTSVIGSQQGKRQAIKQHILDYIETRGLEAGALLPSQNDLAAVCGVTALTVHRALAELVGEHVLHRIRGKGTFVGARPDGTGLRPLCLVLPGERLDSPEGNPTHWEYVQRLVRHFMEVGAGGRTFSVLSLLPEAKPEAQLARLAPGSIVFFLQGMPFEALIRRFDNRNRLAAVVFGDAPDCPCVSIAHNRQEGRRMAVHHLIALGYRRIAFLGGDVPWEAYDYTAYGAALAEAGLPAGPRRIVATDGAAPPHRLAPELLRLHAEGCDAITTGTDPLALQVVDFLRRDGVRVPGDIGVMGYDGLPSATLYPPHLASVRPPYRALIDAAITRIEQHGVPQSGVESIALSAEIVPGETVARRG